VTGGLIAGTPGDCPDTLEGTPGITFSGSVTSGSPSGLSGSFLWTQLVNAAISNWIGPQGQHGYTTTPGVDLGSNVNYPAYVGLSAQDSPLKSLPPPDGDLNYVVSATMYFMWDPALPAGCTQRLLQTPAIAIRSRFPSVIPSEDLAGGHKYIGEPAIDWHDMAIQLSKCAAGLVVISDHYPITT